MLGHTFVDPCEVEASYCSPDNLWPTHVEQGPVLLGHTFCGPTRKSALHVGR